MFEQYVIVPDSARREGGDFTVELRIPYYRGLGLSMVDVELSIDGHPVPRERTTFAVHGSEYALDALPGVIDDRWGFHEAATVRVCDLPVEPGRHRVEAAVSLRISYMPGGPVVTRGARDVDLP